MLKGILLLLGLFNLLGGCSLVGMLSLNELRSGLLLVSDGLLSIKLLAGSFLLLLKLGDVRADLVLDGGQRLAEDLSTLLQLRLVAQWTARQLERGDFLLLFLHRLRFFGRN